MTFRFIHTADVHLDSPLRTLALRNSELADVIANATRQAFERTIDLCIEEKVDALLLAGDLYDGDQTSIKTARFFSRQMSRLHKVGIAVYIIRGNHDALSKITRELELPDNVTVFGGRPESVTIEREPTELPVVIHGLSFTSPQAPDNLVPKYKSPVPGALNIGLLHTSLAGAPGHDPYSPCSITDLVEKGYHYWALGHIHKRAVNTVGECTIVMPGIPQGRDINEAGPKSVSLVAIEESGDVQVTELVTCIAQFERVTVDVTGIKDWSELPNLFSVALQKTWAQTKVPHLVVRLHLIGETSLAWRIRSDQDLLKVQAEECAQALGACWVEKLEIECNAQQQTALGQESPIEELEQLIFDTVLSSENFQREAALIVEQIKKQLPPENRDLFGLDEREFENIVGNFSEEGAKDVIAHLYSDSEGGAG